MAEKLSRILNQIKKELEGIKNELKKSNASRDKRYKEWTKMKNNSLNFWGNDVIVIKKVKYDRKSRQDFESN